MTNPSEKEQAKVQDKELEVELKESSMDEASESKIELVPELPDGYEFIEKLGEGGMGRVYRVRDLSLDKEFAIKILQQDLSKDASALKRFNQEIDAAAALSHANLISIYKHGTTDNGEPYLVMDFVDGPSLAELIEKGTDFAGNADRLLDIFIQICEALAHAHENGVIHRDIKPSNIIITKSADGKDLVKIVDFGIARVIEASNRETHNLTQTGEVFGSPHYMSPEQCLGLMLTQHSDIYSLGCTLYEAITGSPPFAGANPIQLVVKHINENVSGFDKDQKRSKALKQLETITLKCLSKEMDDRYASVTALKEDLKKVKEGKPIPKYVLANSAKQTGISSNILMCTAMGTGLIFCLVYYYPGRLLGINFNALLMVLIFGSGFSALFLNGLTQLRLILTRGNSARQWWQMIMTLSAGLAGLSAIPWLTGFIVNDDPYNTQGLYKSIISCIFMLHVPCLLVLISSSSCWILFKARTASAIYITTRLLLTCIAVAVTLGYIAPDLVSKVTSDAKKAFEINETVVDRPVYSFTRREGILEITRNLAFNGDFEGVKHTLDEELKETKNPFDRGFLLTALARLYSDTGAFQKALVILKKVESGPTEGSEDYICEKARALQGLGKLDEAKNFLKVHTVGRNRLLIGNELSLAIREAQIYSSEGDFDRAIKILDDRILIDQYPAKAVFLRAMLEEQIGLEREAIDDYRNIVYGSLWRDPGKFLTNEDFLEIGYALKRLGDSEGYSALEKKYKKTEKIIPLTSLKYVLGLVDDAVKLKIDDPPLSEAK